MIVVNSDNHAMKTGIIKTTTTKIKLAKISVGVDYFAENYSYVIQDEVQSFHWNNSQCSLHPAVIYFLDSSGKLGTKSFCVVSEDLLHDVPFVHEVQQVLMNWIKANLQGIDSVIYFSDGWAKQ